MVANQVMTAAHLNTPAEKMRAIVTQQQIVDQRTPMEKSFIATIAWTTKKLTPTYAAQKVAFQFFWIYAHQLGKINGITGAGSKTFLKL